MKKQDASNEATGMMRWLLTYADMITLLLGFFVVLYASSSINTKKLNIITTAIKGAFGVPIGMSKVSNSGIGGEKILTEPDLLQQLLEEIEKSLNSQIKIGKVEILRSNRGLILRFQDRTFFELGKADLTGEAQDILDRIAPIMRNIPNTIESEGHTDNLPINSFLFPSNWELSAARATSVVRYFIEKHGISPERLSARGMGEFRPIKENDPVKGQPLNRRVEINILK